MIGVFIVIATTYRGMFFVLSIFISRGAEYVLFVGLERSVLYLLAGERSVLCVGALELACGFLASEHRDGANVPTLDRREK